MKSKIFLTLCLPLFLAVGCGDSAEKHENQRQPSDVLEKLLPKSSKEEFEKKQELTTLAVCKNLGKRYLERLKNKPSDKHTYDECMRLFEKYKDSEPSAK